MWQMFLRYDTKARSPKWKIATLNFMKIKTFIHQRHYQESENTTYKIRVNIFKLCVWYR
jgi:hypothetical protein